MDGVQFVRRLASFEIVRLFALIARRDNLTRFRNSVSEARASTPPTPMRPFVCRGRLRRSILPDAQFLCIIGGLVHIAIALSVMQRLDQILWMPPSLRGLMQEHRDEAIVLC